MKFTLVILSISTCIFTSIADQAECEALPCGEVVPGTEPCDYLDMCMIIQKTYPSGITSSKCVDTLLGNDQECEPREDACERLFCEDVFPGQMECDYLSSCEDRASEQQCITFGDGSSEQQCTDKPPSIAPEPAVCECTEAEAIAGSESSSSESGGRRRLGHMWVSRRLLGKSSKESDPSCECDGKIDSLTFINNGDDSQYTVESKAGSILFDEFILSGGEFTVSPESGEDTLGTKIYINTVELHTSCSITIEIGDTVGDLEIIAGSSLNNGPLCLSGGTEPGPEGYYVACECEEGVTSDSSSSGSNSHSHSHSSDDDGEAAKLSDNDKSVVDTLLTAGTMRYQYLFGMCVGILGMFIN